MRGSGEGRELVGVLLAARRAADAAYLPGKGAQRAVEPPQRPLPGPGPRRNSPRSDPSPAPAEHTGAQHPPPRRLSSLAQRPRVGLERRAGQVIELPRLPVRPDAAVEPAAV